MLKSRKNRSIFPLALVGGLVGSLAVGGIYAGLSTTASSEPESEEIYNNLTFDYAYTVDSEPILKDVTPAATPVAESFTKVISNESSVDANAAFWVEGVDVASVPDSLLDHSQVQIHAGDNSPAVFTLRDFVTKGIVLSQTIAGGADKTLVVTITAPNNGSPVDFSDALDFKSAKFNTNVTFSQIVPGGSPLLNYAVENGTRIAGHSDAVYLIPVEEVETAAGL